MKKRRLDKKNIIIDLTSLLDVIFIILMVVMCNQKADTGKGETTPITPPSTDERVVALSVNVTVDFDDNDDIISRNIELRCGENSIPSVITIDENDVAGDGSIAAYETFSNEIEKYLVSDGEQAAPVLVEVVDGEMLYRDVREVSSRLSELSSEYSNLYCWGLVE